jgi:hypothetical protein
MSRENLELVRRGAEAWHAGDMKALGEVYDPAVVMYHLEGWPEPGPSMGRDAVLREWEQLREPFQGADTLEPVGAIVETSNHVVVRWAWHGSGRGPDTAMEFTMVFTFRQGKIITVQNFWDHAEALAAVGLRE